MTHCVWLILLNYIIIIRPECRRFKSLKMEYIFLKFCTRRENAINKNKNPRNFFLKNIYFFK